MENKGIDLDAAFVQNIRREYGEDAVNSQLEALEKHGKTVDNPRLWVTTALAGDFKFRALEEVPECPCGHRSSTLLCRFVFWNLLALRSCDHCGMMRVSPRLVASEMTRIFNADYFEEDGPASWDNRRENIFRDIHRFLPRSEFELFDIGTAYGHFIRWLRDRGIPARGSDISASSAEWGRKHLGVEIMVGSFPSLPLEENSIGCLTSIDAFYYVADPREELLAMYRALRPGGLLIMRLRNGLHTRARAMSGGADRVSAAPLPSQHLWAFTPSSIERLLKSLGYVEVWSDPAVHSTARFSSALDATTSANRAFRAIAAVPVLTQSFTVLARKPARSVGG